jgi:hypothetical protein
MADQKCKEQFFREEEVRNVTAILRCLSVRTILYSVITGAVSGRVGIVIIGILTITAIIPYATCQYKPDQQRYSPENHLFLIH